MSALALFFSSLFFIYKTHSIAVVTEKHWQCGGVGVNRDLVLQPHFLMNFILVISNNILCLINFLEKAGIKCCCYHHGNRVLFFFFFLLYNYKTVD